MARQCLTEPIIKLIVLLINKFSAEGLISGSLRYPPPCRLIERLCICYPQSRQSVGIVVGIGTPPLPHPHTRFRERRWGESQFRRGDIHCGTLYIQVLCATIYLRNISILSIHGVLNILILAAGTL
jgi:hypothetical protein